MDHSKTPLKQMETRLLAINSTYSSSLSFLVHVAFPFLLLLVIYVMFVVCMQSVVIFAVKLLYCKLSV